MSLNSIAEQQNADFLGDYTRYLRSCKNNSFDNNYDLFRFNKPERSIAKLRTRRLKKALRRSPKAVFYELMAILDPKWAGLQLVESSLDHWQWLYDRVEDAASRDTLVRILAYRALGHRKVKLATNDPEFWATMHHLDALTAEAERRDAHHKDWVLWKFDLGEFGFPIRLFLRPPGVFHQFIRQQYRCRDAEGAEIRVEPGDRVIDAGGCYGDTALYFAHEAGIDGRVLSFEFLPENLAVFADNLAENPDLAERIEIIEKPVWSRSDEEVYIERSGPGTRISLRPTAASRVVRTMAIDDAMREGHLDRVDFIKMDIEGAENAALRGAEDTLKRDRPKLAISLYHRLSDFWTIPQYLDSLNCGYHFYIRHFTIHREETVLFAQCPQ